MHFFVVFYLYVVCLLCNLNNPVPCKRSSTSSGHRCRGVNAALKTKPSAVCAQIDRKGFFPNVCAAVFRSPFTRFETPDDNNNTPGERWHVWNPENELENHCKKKILTQKMFAEIETFFSLSKHYASLQKPSFNLAKAFYWISSFQTLWVSTFFESFCFQMFLKSSMIFSHVNTGPCGDDSVSRRTRSKASCQLTFAKRCQAQR